MYVIIKGRCRVVHRGKNGGHYYIKNGRRVYVNAKTEIRHGQKPKVHSNRNSPCKTKSYKNKARSRQLSPVERARRHEKRQVIEQIRQIDPNMKVDARQKVDTLRGILAMLQM